MSVRDGAAPPVTLWRARSTDVPMARTDDDGPESPPGWVVETEEEDARSWLGPTEYVVCERSVENGDEWTAYVQPRGELAEPVRTPLVEEGVGFEQALAEVREYMRRNGAVE